MTTQEWIEKTPGMKELLDDLECNKENSSDEEFKRHCAIMIRQWLESKNGK